MSAATENQGDLFSHLQPKAPTADDLFPLRSEGWREANRCVKAVSNKNDEWVDFVVKHIATIVPGTSFVVEDLYDYVNKNQPVKPSSRMAWGGAMARARKRGLVEPLEYRMAEGSKVNHPKHIRVWMRK